MEIYINHIEFFLVVKNRCYQQNYIYIYNIYIYIIYIYIYIYNIYLLYSKFVKKPCNTLVYPFPTCGIS